MSPLPLLILIKAKDVTNLPLPQNPIKGSLFKTSFKPTKVTLKKIGISKAMAPRLRDQAQTYHLTFRTGKEFIADQQVQIAFNLDLGDKLNGLKLTRKPISTDDPMTPLFMWKGKKRAIGMGLTGVIADSKSTRKSDLFSMEYSAKVEFGTPQKGKIPGRIILQLPDEKGTLAGAFSATLE
jgi:hypothetical protein